MQARTGTDRSRVEALQNQCRTTLVHGDRHGDVDVFPYGLESAPRLWQGITIDAGYEDALEAVLRERLNALAVAGLETCGDWSDNAPPGKLAVADTMRDCRRRHVGADACTRAAARGLCHLSRCPAGAGIARLAAQCLCRGKRSRCRPRIARATCRSGRCWSLRDGYLFTRNSLTFHAPDSELHGVLSRQSEIETLDRDIVGGKTELLASACRG